MISFHTQGLVSVMLSQVSKRDLIQRNLINKKGVLSGRLLHGFFTRLNPWTQSLPGNNVPLTDLSFIVNR